MWKRIQLHLRLVCLPFQRRRDENSLDEQLEEEDVDAGGAAEVVAALEVVTATLVVAGPDGFVLHKFLESQDWPTAQDVELDAPGD